MALSDGQQEHPHSCKKKSCDGEEKTALAHVSVVEFCRGTGEEQNRGERGGIDERRADIGLDDISRAALEARYAEVADRYRDASAPVPCPPHWGGYRLSPDSIEFWQGRASRLHDRIRYRRTQAHPAAWVVDRLAP